MDLKSFVTLGPGHKKIIWYIQLNRPGSNTLKIFIVMYGLLQLARLFVRGKPFQLILMFVCRAKSLLKSGPPERCSQVGSNI